MYSSFLKNFVIPAGDLLTGSRFSAAYAETNAMAEWEPGRLAEFQNAKLRRLIDHAYLNVPYYHTSVSNHYQHKGSRRMMPDDLDAVLEAVAAKRCASCHAEGVPRKFYTRILEPQNNSFLLAPLAKSAGGTEACGRPIFESKDDPDYRAVLATFEPIQELLEGRPRMDMTGAACECAISQP